MLDLGGSKDIRKNEKWWGFKLKKFPSWRKRKAGPACVGFGHARR